MKVHVRVLLDDLSYCGEIKRQYTEHIYNILVVKNKPPRKALVENLGPFMPACCFSLIFYQFFIYIYKVCVGMCVWWWGGGGGMR